MRGDITYKLAKTKSLQLVVLCLTELSHKLVLPYIVHVWLVKSS